MPTKFPPLSILAMLGFAAAVLAGCSSTTPAPIMSTPEAREVADLPSISSVEIDRSEVARYESLELSAALKAQYSNPYDARSISLNGIFTAPDGKEMVVPGFWDGEEAWRVRFTPWQEGRWSYELVVKDERGESAPAAGGFTVTESELHGWLQVGSWVNPDYSSRYLVHHDGTPFYGIGHCDPLNILADGFSIESGVRLFDNMQEAGENYVVWWPLYNNSPINSSYDDYAVQNLKVIDLIVKDAQKKGIFLIFTIWDHPQLRTGGHPWGGGRWDASNGFRKLGDIDSFFTSDEAWAWQENFYRYMIARWGYSPAIGMWQTVSEINGTNAYSQADPWHKRISDYFAQNDPYRHPTTASKSGDTDWPAGHQAMDAPQVHVYEFGSDAVKAGRTIAYWTEQMWQREEKPNWVGEFGVPGNSLYPELFHNSIWAALGAGAAMTPAEWNDRGSWMQMTPEMNADLARLARFVEDIPLAHLNPSALQVSSSDPEVRGWGVAGDNGGLFWVQDFSLEGKPVSEIRAAGKIRRGVEVSLGGMSEATFHVRPYDTWKGIFLDTFDVTCAAGHTCSMPLPDFKADMAFQLVRK